MRSGTRRLAPGATARPKTGGRQAGQQGPPGSCASVRPAAAAPTGPPSGLGVESPVTLLQPGLRGGAQCALTRLPHTHPQGRPIDPGNGGVGLHFKGDHRAGSRGH